MKPARLLLGMLLCVCAIASSCEEEVNWNPGVESTGGGGAPYYFGFNNLGDKADWWFYDYRLPDTPPRLIGEVEAMPWSRGTGTFYFIDWPDGSPYGLQTSGAVVSPLMDISGFTHPVLTFRCSYQKGDKDEWDFNRRVFLGTRESVSSIEIKDMVVLIRAEQENSAIPSAQVCPVEAKWHSHQIDLGSSWGVMFVAFDYDDVAHQSYLPSRWTIDDVFVRERVWP